MPRKYERKPGAKTYKKYDDLVIKQALDEIALTNASLGIVAEKYNISKSVLCRHKNKEMKPHGRPTALTKEEEIFMVENLNVCGDWGYPLDTTDLRYIIKMYLDKMNIKHKIFKNNLPGKDYVDGFLKRHSDKISKRLCQNIKRSRAAVSPDTIKKYFAELEMSLENVPAQNIINYDETNLTDDPGRKMVIVRRGCKYPERIVNHTKGSTSLMMAATADGEFLPPYVVYKSAHLYDTWTVRGPQNTRYNRSSSGWFDGNIFEDWVKTIVIPFLENKDGKKVLIGDNLSSHLSFEIIQLCKKKDIQFVFLPANSTHLTQPLDVAVFRPMKMIWRQLLDKWKKSDDGRTQSCVPKGCFPRLLKLLMDELSINAEKNIKAGFKKCGILPLDANEVLVRLPQQEENSDEKLTAVNDSFFQLLKDMRYGSMSIREPKTKKKLDVVAGRSVSSEEVAENDVEEPTKPKKKKIVKQKNKPIEKTTLKGKGVGKKTKTKTEKSQTQDDESEKYSDIVLHGRRIEEEETTNQNLITMTMLQNENGNEAPLAIEPAEVIPEVFDFSIESLPIIFADNLDCQEVIVKTDYEDQKTQDHDKENVNFQIENKPKPDIKIISDVKFKLPLPLKRTSTPTLRKGGSSGAKRGRSLSIDKDSNEILKLLEED